MPLIAHSNLPTFERLKTEGHTVLTPEKAQEQDIRELHIGLLNMMPDAALAATERQFFRLVSESNHIVQFYLHPFTLKELPRGSEAQEYIQRYYRPLEELQKDGLDALIITGANVSQPNLSDEPFWKPLIEVIDWALEQVASTVCSCLATHALLESRHGQKRRRLPAKRWGVYRHRVCDRSHPLVHNVNTLFDVPHSRYNEVSREQFEAAGLHVLAESEAAGVHLAVSEDRFRVVFFQGHQEYDTTSLLKEYKREVNRFVAGERDDYPPFPENYLPRQAQAILEEYRDAVLRGRDSPEPDSPETAPEFPEGLITRTLDNTWHDTGEAVIDNWIGKVYEVTDTDRTVPFMKHVNPQDPLGLRS